MQYVVWGGAGAPPAGSAGVQVLAGGEVLELEGPWPLGPTALAFAAEDAALARLPAPAGAQAYAVAGIAPPAEGEAFVIAAHRMRDAEGFRPYAEAIPALLARFGVRVLARGGTVTPLAGAFAPDRAVVLEFRDAEAVLEFYTSELYAPLLALRLRTTDPRFIVVTRSGRIPAAVREAAARFLPARSLSMIGRDRIAPDPSS